jgi:hypothetical protein
MSISTWLIPLIGLLVIYFIYRKVLAESGTVYILKNADSRTTEDPKYDAKYQLATSQKVNYQITFFICGFNFLFIFANMKFDFIAAWFVLFITGALGSICRWFFLEHRKSWNSLHLNEIPNSLELEYSKSAKNIFIFLLIISSLSINWAYQVEKNQSVQKQEAVNEIVKIAGKGWCANFYDIQLSTGSDGLIDDYKTGGWPCIQVSSIYNVDFSKNKKDMNLCFSYSLERSEGPPSESRYIGDFTSRRVCVSDNPWKSWGEGWRQQSFETKIFENLESDLDKLETTMCKLYSSRLSNEELNVYC